MGGKQKEVPPQTTASAHEGCLTGGTTGRYSPVWVHSHRGACYAAAQNTNSFLYVVHSAISVGKRRKEHWGKGPDLSCYLISGLDDATW